MGKRKKRWGPAIPPGAAAAAAPAAAPHPPQQQDQPPHPPAHPPLQQHPLPHQYPHYPHLQHPYQLLHGYVPYGAYANPYQPLQPAQLPLPPPPPPPPPPRPDPPHHAADVKSDYYSYPTQQSQHAQQTQQTQQMQQTQQQLPPPQAQSHSRESSPAKNNLPSASSTSSATNLTTSSAKSSSSSSASVAAVVPAAAAAVTAKSSLAEVTSTSATTSSTAATSTAGTISMPAITSAITTPAAISATAAAAADNDPFSKTIEIQRAMKALKQHKKLKKFQERRLKLHRQMLDEQRRIFEEKNHNHGNGDDDDDDYDEGEIIIGDNDGNNNDDDDDGYETGEEREDEQRWQRRQQQQQNNSNPLQLFEQRWQQPQQRQQHQQNNSNPLQLLPKPVLESEGSDDYSTIMEGSSEGQQWVQEKANDDNGTGTKHGNDAAASSANNEDESDDYSTLMEDSEPENGGIPPTAATATTATTLNNGPVHSRLVGEEQVVEQASTQSAAGSRQIIATASSALAAARAGAAAAGPAASYTKKYMETFNSKDAALKVLKQRKRMAAVEKWKKNIVGGGFSEIGGIIVDEDHRPIGMENGTKDDDGMIRNQQEQQQQHQHQHQQKEPSPGNPPRSEEEKNNNCLEDSLLSNRGCFTNQKKKSSTPPPPPPPPPPGGFLQRSHSNPEKGNETPKPFKRKPPPPPPLGPPTYQSSSTSSKRGSLSSAGSREGIIKAPMSHTGVLPKKKPPPPSFPPPPLLNRAQSDPKGKVRFERANTGDSFDFGIGENAAVRAKIRQNNVKKGGMQKLSRRNEFSSSDRGNTTTKLGDAYFKMDLSSSSEELGDISSGGDSDWGNDALLEKKPRATDKSSRSPSKTERHGQRTVFEDSDGEKFEYIPRPKKLRKERRRQSSSSLEENDIPLLDLWRKKRHDKNGHKSRTTKTDTKQKEKRKKKHKILDSDHQHSGHKKKSKSKHHLFRRRILLNSDVTSKVETSTRHSFPNHAHDSNDIPKEDLRKQESSRNCRTRENEKPSTNLDSMLKKGAAHGGLFGSLWDCGSDSEDLTMGKRSSKGVVDIIGIDIPVIHSRTLPHAQNLLFWSQTRCADEANDGDDSMDVRNRVCSLRERITEADALIQSAAPSYLEFKSKNWGSNRKAEHQTATTIVTKASLALAPCSKSFSSSHSARDFLMTLQSAVKEANRNSKLSNANAVQSATTIVADFLGIIKEARTNSQMSTFRLMQRVWALIMPVVSRCDDGVNLGNELASKFDAFLPKGYSMLSVNNLMLEGLQTKPKNRAINFVEGCARTDLEFSSKNRLS